MNFLLSELFARGMKLKVQNKNQHSIKDQNKFTFPGVDGALRRKPAFTYFGHQPRQGVEKFTLKQRAEHSCNRNHSIQHRLRNSAASRPRIQDHCQSHIEFKQIFNSGDRIQTKMMQFLRILVAYQLPQKWLSVQCCPCLLSNPGGSIGLHKSTKANQLPIMTWDIWFPSKCASRKEENNYYDPNTYV